MKRLLPLLLALLLPSIGYGAMTCTATNLAHPSDSGATKHGKLYTCPWTTDASGDASVAVSLKGFISLIETVPSAVTAPTALYDISLYSPNKSTFDVLNLTLNDRSATVGEAVPAPNSGKAVLVYVNGTYTLTVANGGNAKLGTIYIYLINP